MPGWTRQANGQWTQREHLISLSYDATTPRDDAATEPDGIEATAAFTASDYAQYDSFGATWQFVGAENPNFAWEKAVRAGRDANGETLYVGRAFHEGDMLPAKVSPSNGIACVSYGGEEIVLTDYEVLRTGDFVWEFATNGEVPEGAVEGGRTVDGEKLYFGRAIHEGTQTPGKVQVSHGCLYIPFDGAEVALTEYEVLCVK